MEQADEKVGVSPCQSSDRMKCVLLFFLNLSLSVPAQHIDV